jgi:hypothetical protein
VTSRTIAPPPGDMAETSSLGMTVVVAGEVVAVEFSGAQADLVRECRCAAMRAWAACDPELTEVGPRTTGDVRCVLGYASSADEGDLAVRVALTQLSRDITRVLVDRREGTHVLLHAAGLLSSFDGRCVVLVGPSGAGKTTFARAHQRDGYLTDELALVDSAGMVAPYPKPFSVVTADRVKDERAPASAVRTARRLGALIVLDRVAEPTLPTATRLDLAESLAAIVPHTSRLSSLHDPLTCLARLIEMCGGAVRLRYSEAGDVDLESLLVLCEERDVSFTAVGHVARQPRGLEGALVRSPSADVLETGEDLLVFVHDQLLRLSPGAASVWRSCRTESTVDHIVGTTGLGREPVRDLVDELISFGVLLRT